MGEDHGRNGRASRGAPARGWLFEPTFNRAIKLRHADPRISSDAGALLLREADHRLGLTADLAAQLIDPRRADRIRYTQVELLRQHIYAAALGYAHQDDADTLAHDVAMKLAVWDRPSKQVADERLASQPSDWRLIERLAEIKPNLEATREALAQWVGRHQRAAGQGRMVTHGTLDIDPFPIEVHGRQPGGAYHGHYRQTVYQPLAASFCGEGGFASSRLGEGFVHAILRRGNCGSAESMVRFARETIRKSRSLARHLDVRIDAGLVNGRVLDAIDDEGVRFVGRIKKNAVLDALAQPFLKRSPGRPLKDGEEFAVELGPYRAKTWRRAYRLVLVMIDLPDPKTGMRDLFPHYFFLVTNWREEQRGGWALVEHYRKRGTFEDRLGEFQQAIGPHLSHAEFQENETVLRLALLAFNLASTLRIEYEAAAGSCFDLARFQRDVLKAGARITKHARRLIVHVARVVRPFWEELVTCLRRWRLPPSYPTPRGPQRRDWMPPPRHAFLSEVRRL